MAAAKNKKHKNSRKNSANQGQPLAAGSAATFSNEPVTTTKTGTGLATSFTVPGLIAGSLLLLSFTPRIQQNSVLTVCLVAAAVFLLAWQVYLYVHFKNASLKPVLTVVLRPQHYVQAMVQFSVYVYWGFYWRPVYDHALLILAQLLFAYAFDMLLSWSRRRDYSLGFGPFPIIFSINLFLWFRDDWFYLQFLMIALGFMGKEYVRWQREGRSVHIFNPSAFALGLFSLVLIVTNTTSLTWGQDIASTLTLAPNIYTFLFLSGLVVMYFFSITLVAGMAAITLFTFSALYSATAGVPYFLDSEIPAAVFLGLHLLITDPSTSPRTPLGKAIFGVLYGLGVVSLYSLLGAIGVPTFYDKLLCVPLLNLSVIAIDRLVRSISSESVVSMWRSSWFGGRANIAHMTVWIVIFASMTVLGRTDGKHTGDSLPFWQQACSEGLPNACERLLQLEATYCGDSAAWACNELGAQYAEGRITALDSELSLFYFARACELKFQAGCVNLLGDLLDGQSIAREPPHELDLRLMLREGGLNLMETPVAELYARACSHDWKFACDRNRVGS